MINFETSQNLYEKKNVLTNKYLMGIIARQLKLTCECAGTGRQARLRGVCLWRTGSSPVTRTKKTL